MEKLFDVGTIVNTHGMKGEVKVSQITDNNQRFLPGEVLFIENEPEELLELTIKTQRFHKGHSLLRFEEITSIFEAEKLKGKTLKVKEKQLPTLDEGSYYIYEILACEVYTLEGDLIGNVTNVFKTGANDVWEITREDGQEYLVPFIKDVVKNVNPKEKKIIIQPMEGMLD